MLEKLSQNLALLTGIVLSDLAVRLRVGNDA